MTIEQAEQILREYFQFPRSPYDEEELETYLLGPDDPEEYFGEIESETELVEDFRSFTDGEEEPMKLKGYEAINYAEAHGLTLSSYNDPTEDARNGLTPEEARRIASEDPNLIYLDVDGADHDTE